MAMRLLLAVMGVAGGAYLAGVLLASSQLQAQGALVAFAALLGYVALATRSTAHRVRWPLLAGVLAVGVTVCAGLLWPPPVTEFGWFSYGPLSERDSEVAFLDTLNDSGPSGKEALLVWERIAAHQRWSALGMLVGICCFAAAVLGLPRRDRPTLTHAAIVVAVLMVGLTLADLGFAAGNGLARLAGAMWAPLLAGVVAAVTSVVAVQRGRHGWLAGLGVAALGFAMLSSAALMAGAMPLVLPLDREALTAEFTATVVLVGWPGIDVTGALLAAAVLAGPLLIALGVRQADTP